MRITLIGFLIKKYATFRMSACATPEWWYSFSWDFADRRSMLNRVEKPPTIPSRLVRSLEKAA